MTGGRKNGASGWSYADVLPYFKRAERHFLGGDSYHGADGPLEVFAPDFKQSPLAAAFVDAAVQAGYPLTRDVNGEQQEGFGRIDRTTRKRPAVGAPHERISDRRCTDRGW